MKGMIATGAWAALFALAPLGAWADTPGNQPEQAQGAVAYQVQLVESLSEIKELAVVRMRRSAAGPEVADDDPAAMPEEDLLLGGFGERRMLTAEDEDDPIEPERTPDQQARTHGPNADSANADGPENGPLQEAIERNRALSDALRERGVSVAQVVSIEVRDGASVIVYVDETRG